MGKYQLFAFRGVASLQFSNLNFDSNKAATYYWLDVSAICFFRLIRGTIWTNQRTDLSLIHVESLSPRASAR